MSEDARRSNITAELSAGKTITYFTVGISMRPLLRERKTHVTIAPVAEAHRGDILLYARKNGSLVLHRCRKTDAEHYYMRGDNTYGSECIKKEQAIGVVTHIYRRGKYFEVKTCKIYKAYTALWNLIYPMRWFLRKCKNAARRLIQ